MLHRVGDGVDMTKYTDDQLLNGAFHRILHLEGQLNAHLYGDPSYWFKDGFEKPIEEDMVSEWLHDLAERCGFKLIDGFWKYELEHSLDAYLDGFVGAVKRELDSK